MTKLQLEAAFAALLDRIPDEKTILSLDLGAILAPDKGTPYEDLGEEMIMLSEHRCMMPGRSLTADRVMYHSVFFRKAIDEYALEAGDEAALQMLADTFRRLYTEDESAGDSESARANYQEIQDRRE